MTDVFSWVDLVGLVVAVATLAVTVAIFFVGRRLSFRQQRERVQELQAKAWEVLGPIRNEELSSKVIVMNVDRYKRGYDGSNRPTRGGNAFTGPEIIEIGHGGVEFITRGIESYLDAKDRRTLEQTSNPAQTVAECGHIPWTWIEDIASGGDEFDGSAIFFVRYRAPGRQPYNYITYREGRPVPFGPDGRNYYRPIPELGTNRPRFFRDWWHFWKSLLLNKNLKAQLKHNVY